MTTFTARQIVDTLALRGYTARWVNTGGGVYNIEIAVVAPSDRAVFMDQDGVTAYVSVSDWGGWQGDSLDDPCAAPTVGMTDAVTGDMVPPSAWARWGTRNDTYLVDRSDYVSCQSVEAVVEQVEYAAAHAQKIDGE